MRLEVDKVRDLVPHDGRHLLVARTACAEWVVFPTVTPDRALRARVHDAGNDIQEGT